MSVALQTWAIVVAGGSGARFGRRKQLVTVAGRRVIDWSLDVLRPHVDGVVAVMPNDLVTGATAIEVDADVVVAGGDSRSASVRAGLEALPGAVQRVLVHDAARPLTNGALVERVLAALAQADAVVPVVPVTDTLRLVSGGTADRSQFVAVQTPQGFAVHTLRQAHRHNSDATDDAALVDQLGGKVVHVDGDPGNLKITVPHDLVLAEALFKQRAAEFEPKGTDQT